MLTVQEVQDYLGIDEVDDMISRGIERMIKTVDREMKLSVGENYDPEDELGKEIALMIVEFMYQHGDFSDRVSKNTQEFIRQSCLKLRLSMRGGSDV